MCSKPWLLSIELRTPCECRIKACVYVLALVEWAASARGALQKLAWLKGHVNDPQRIVDEFVYEKSRNEMKMQDMQQNSNCMRPCEPTSFFRALEGVI